MNSKKILKNELKFLKSKEVKECIKRADYGCCHEIPSWYTKRIKYLKTKLAEMKL